MEIFKLFESTIPHIQPGHLSTKDLRRDQLLDNYDEATKTLQALIKAKESELAYRRDLVEMLDKSKSTNDNKLKQAKQAYQTAKKYAPDSLDLKSPIKIKTESTQANEMSSSAIPIIGSSMSRPTTSLSTTPPPLPFTSSTQHQPMMISPTGMKMEQSSQRGSDLDIPLPTESIESRSSLDRRLSEFLKTFPNLTQAGLAQPSENNLIPLPGYYTQQQPQPPPITAAAPPMMAMMRFPPPNMMGQVLHHNQHSGGSGSSSGSIKQVGSERNRYSSPSSTSSRSSNRSRHR